MAPRYVIVGASLAGATAAITLRKEGADGTVTLIGAEHEPPYERPPLSKAYLRGEVPFDKALVRPGAFYAEQGIRLDEARLLAQGALQSARRVLEPSRMAVCEDACGWVAFRQGRLDEAVDLLQDAVEHSGGHAQQWAHLARALEARDDPEGIERARDIWQQIAEQFPHSGTAEQARRHLDLLTQG